MKLKRVAVLIEGFDSGKTASVLQQFKFDISSFQLFLKSPVGGMWDEAEIITMQAPSLHDLRNLTEYFLVDYVLLYFSGHGNGANGASYISLNENESINVSELPDFASKQLFIFDSCRAMPQNINEVYLYYPERIPIDGGLVTRIYQEYLAKCENGTTYCFSCSYGESAHSDSDGGGYFTNSLISEVTAWSISPSNRPILTLKEACMLSYSKIRLCYDHQQQPVVITRSKFRNLPFAVNLRMLLNENSVNSLFDFNSEASK
jgi:Caspase domain